MANNFAPFGFRDVARIDGASWNAQISTRLIAASNATAIFQGDPVTTLNTGYVARSTAGTTQIHGIFIGCEYTSIAMGRRVYSPYWPGSDANGDVTAKVINDPYVMFTVQSGTGGPATLAAVGQNINFALGTGNTASGISGAYADFSTLATTATLPFRVVGLGNALGNGSDNTSAGNLIFVIPNNWDFKSTTGI